MLAAFLLLLAAETDTGQAEGAKGSTPTSSTEADPVICRSVAEIGSLLRKNKVCMRRSEWREQRQIDKQMIDRSQLQRPTSGG